jgi:RNA polymerase-binding transcription factor DksA
MANPKVTAAAKAALESERAELLHQLAEFGTGEGSMSFDENFADSGQVAAEQGETRVLAASLQEQLADVEHALEKLDAGSYGKCETCGEDIPDARLEALPASRFCMTHA